MEEHVRRNAAVLVLFMVGLAPFALGAAQVNAKAAGARRTLKVKLNYTGAGVVDEKHQIYVLLFDANAFTSSTLIDATSQPTPPAPVPGVAHILARQGTAGKDGIVSFRELRVSPVFAAAFLDKQGSYDGHSDPAPGSPMGVYGKLPDKLEPIKVDPGKTTQVAITFDDSTTTP